MNTIVGYIVLLAAVIVILYVIRKWISTYNKFQYWIEKAQQKFSDVDVVMQERIDRLHALAQIVKKYDIHEYKALKDVIEARSKWSKDLPLDEKVKLAGDIENTFMHLTAVIERYPEIKGDKLHDSLLRENSRMESRLRGARKGYNKVIRKYNYRVRKFPRSIVAQVHGFKPMEYLVFEGQQPYAPKEIFDE